jgi:DNA-binding winged helix-turn-helix (wHTH) protein/tetratricopeptide (TPR) repeat protein
MDRLEPASAGFARTGCRFGGFRLDADGTLLHGETQVHLSPKELAALRLLLANPGRTVTPQELKQALWGDAPAPVEGVSKCLVSLRKKLEPEACIETVYKRGYRISAVVRALVEPAGPPLRLAILPFTVEYGVPEYLGAAIAQETGARIEIARSGGTQPAPVLIVAKESVFTLAQRGIQPQQIAEMLKADLILKGSLRALPGHYRLHAEMIYGADGSQAWVEDLLVDRNRIGGLETELVNLINLRMNAGGLSISASASTSATPGDEKQEPERMAERREAYEYFQRGRFEWKTLERHRMQDALRHLLQAVELDPELPAARVELAHLCVAQAYYGFMPPVVAADMVRRTVRTPEEIPAGAEGILPALGWISFHVDRNMPAALWCFGQAETLPYEPWAMRALTQLVLSRHRFREAIDLLESAMRVDPWSAWPQARLAWAHHLAGEAAASVQLAHTALERFPLHEGVQLYGSIILAFNGETARAVDLAGALARRLPYFDLATGAHAYALAMAGHADASRAILERLEWLSRERYAMKTFSTAAYVALGEPEKALGELRSAEQSRCPWFFQMLADPRLATLRADPEFQSMLGMLAGMEAEAERDTLAE